MSNEIEMFRGDSKPLNVTVKDGDGDVVPLTGAEIICSAKMKGSNNISFVRKNIAAGGDATQIEDVDLANGNFKIYLIPTNTKNLQPGKYEYDIEITIGTNVYTVILDDLLLKKDITI